MAFTPITVTGMWTQPGVGSPSRGTVSFRLYEPLTDQETRQVSSGTTTARLDDSGSISVVLAASNDPTSRPEGTPYLVTENVDGTQRSYYVTIPYDAAGGTVNLATLVPLLPPFPGVDPVQIPPSPVGQPNGYVVTVANGVYTLAPVPGGGGYTGPVQVDLSGATPGGEGIVPVDLSALEPGASSVVIVLPTWGTPVTALVAPPSSSAFGPLPITATAGDNTTVCAISMDSPIGTIPVAASGFQATALLAPISYPVLGVLWLSVPPPGFQIGGLLNPYTLSETVDAVAAAVLTDTGLTVDPAFVSSITSAFQGKVTGAPFLPELALLNVDPATFVLLQAAFTAQVLSTAGGATLALVPITDGATWNGLVTSSTFGLPAAVASSRFALADGATVNVVPIGLDPGQQMRTTVVIYNGYGPDTGGTLAVSLNGVPLDRANDIPVGSARSFQIAARNIGGTITAVADYGTTIPSGSPDY